MGRTTNETSAATTDDPPLLDPKVQEQLRRELYGTGLTEDDSLVSKHTQGIGNSSSNSTNLTTGMWVIGGSMLGLLGMQLPFLFIKHAPFMATPPRKIQHALKFLQRQRRHTRPLSSASTATTMGSASSPTSPPMFVDLGSGDGQAVYEAAKLGYKAVGIEFNWTLWALSSLRRHFFWPLEVKRRSELLLQDFSNYNLKDANTIMIFAVPRTMPVLGRKIQSECSPGTTIMAYRFEMPLANGSNATHSDEDETEKTVKSDLDTATTVMTPSERNDEDDEDLRLRATCIYDQEEMRIYRMGE